RRCWRRMKKPTPATANAAPIAEITTRESSHAWRSMIARDEATQVTTQLPVGRDTASETCTAAARPTPLAPAASGAICAADGAGAWKYLLTVSVSAALQPPGVEQPAHTTPPGSVTKRRDTPRDGHDPAARNIAASLATTTAPPPLTGVPYSKNDRVPNRAGSPMAFTRRDETSRARCCIGALSASTVGSFSVGSTARISTS